MIRSMILRALMATAFVLAIVVASSTVYFDYFEPSWLEYMNMPFPVGTDEQGNPPKEMPVLHPGDSIPFYNVRCNTSGRDQFYTVVRRLVRVDLQQPDIELPSGDVTVPAGCGGIISRRNAVPSGAPPIPRGIYVLQGTTYVPLRGRTPRLAWATQPFRIEP